MFSWNRAADKNNKIILAILSILAKLSSNIVPVRILSQSHINILTPYN